MQKLTTEQGDAVLDVVCQSRVVNQAWEQSQAAEEATAGETVETDTYQKALARLTNLVYRSKEMGVSESVLDGVLTRNLPSEVFSSLKPKTAA